MTVFLFAMSVIAVMLFIERQHDAMQRRMKVRIKEDRDSRR